MNSILRKYNILLDEFMTHKNRSLSRYLKNILYTLLYQVMSTRNTLVKTPLMKKSTLFSLCYYWFYIQFNCISNTTVNISSWVFIILLVEALLSLTINYVLNVTRHYLRNWSQDHMALHHYSSGSYAVSTVCVAEDFESEPNMEAQRSPIVYSYWNII